MVNLEGQKGQQRALKTVEKFVYYSSWLSFVEGPKGQQRPLKATEDCLSYSIVQPHELVKHLSGAPL